MKTCTKCKEIKYKLEFNKDKYKKDNLSSQCKSCIKAHKDLIKEKYPNRRKETRKKYAEKYPEKTKELNKKYSKDYRKKYPERKKESDKNWREQNKEKKQQSDKNYQIKNKNLLSIYNKNYRKINKESLSEKAKLYNKQNKEKIHNAYLKYKEQNKEKIQHRSAEYYKNNLDKILKYRKENPEKIRNLERKRRAKKRKANGSHTPEDILNLLVLQNTKCKYCEVQLNTEGKMKYHIDHRMPLVLGGSNNVENLQILCPRCNLTKSAKHPDIYEKEIGLR